jgi:hypothetical protein
MTCAFGGSVENVRCMGATPSASACGGGPRGVLFRGFRPSVCSGARGVLARGFRRGLSASGRRFRCL